MPPLKHLWTTCSVLLMAALLAACAAPAAAPTATPVPPTATPVPPTATPGPLDVARAYETAWNTFDAAAVTALFAEPFNTDYGFPMTDKTAWSEGWPYGMARGMGMRIAMHDCEVSGDTVTCKVASQSPCFTMDVIEALTVQDGKITKLEHRGIPAEDARWEEYSTAVEKWAEEQGLDEWPAYQAEVAKRTYGYDWGAGFVSLCQKYEAAMQAQANDPIAVVQAWHDAINNGDLDGVLALMTEDATIKGWRPPVRGVLNWLIDIKTHFGVQDCQQDGEQLACDVIMTDDGCITASGNTHGLPLHHVFAMQDGKIHDVSYGDVATTEDWDRYGKWLEGEDAWAKAFRAEEWAISDRAVNSDAGEIAIKLCQEYADFLEKQVPVITASAQALVDAINGGDVDAAVALLIEDAKVTFAKDQAAGKDQLSSLFNWLAGKETQVQIKDCVWQGDKLVCTMSVVDGCMAASGAPEGLPDGMITFLPQEEGALRNVVGVLSVTERKPYEAWLEAEAAWASANRADEFAQAEGYSREAGAMAVKLCREYAETLK